MTRRGEAKHGDGTAVLVVDRLVGDYLCYWYAGRSDSDLIEFERVATDSGAVAWGNARTPRVRIRTPDGNTSWAGSAPRPEGFSLTWAAA